LRIRWYSSGTGSLTLSTRSLVDHTSSAVGAMLAPAATKSASGIAEPVPASASMNT